MSVGLHILYGVMGSGKTNYAVNELWTMMMARFVALCPAL